MTDLQAKYQKLAAEYSKLRAQVPVLKKAVLDEQGKEEGLRESLKEKNQSIRKFEQEIDSLSFRNQQLSARVEVLQRELEEATVRSSKKQKKNSPATPESFRSDESVIGEELHNKIEENVRLHKQFHEADRLHRDTVMQLQDQLTKLESDASRHQKVLDSTTTNTKTQIDKLQEEKAVLQVKLQKQEVVSKESRERAESIEEELKTISKDLGENLAAINETVANKLPFNDTESQEFNSLNIPTHDRKHQLQTKELVSQAVTLVKELVNALSNFYTYYEQRTKVYPVDADQEALSDVNNKLCQYLHNNVINLRPIEHSFKKFHESLKDDSLTTLETAVGLGEFSASFKQFNVYANTLLPYQLLSLEEECSVSACPPGLVTKNMELHSSLKNFVSSISLLETYISLVSLQSSTFSSHPKSSHRKMLQLLSESITDFRDSVKDISKHFNAKVSLEHQLPTASQKLKVTDECIISALVSIVTCSNKITTFFSGNLEFLYKEVGFLTRGASNNSAGTSSHPVVSSFQQRAADYMNMVNKPHADSVPYRTAIQNRRTLYSSTESRDSLAQQVVTLQERVTKLEQEKEHWMLETQLLQMKYEKEVEKVAKIGNSQTSIPSAFTEDRALSNGIGSMSSTAPGGPVPGTVVQDSMLGQLVVMPDEHDQSDQRESLIKQHYTKRIAELNTKLQMADSQALHFHAECRALHKRLSLSQKEQKTLQGALDTANQTITQLKDELQTTTKSYEGQLSMMSEHLAGMNEKLTSQKDEIDALKYQMSNVKLGKKGKK